MATFMKHYGKIFTTGNKFEFWDIENQLIKRKINFIVFHTNGMRTYAVPENELEKLPIDSGDRYLPLTDKEGYSIYPLEIKELIYHD